MVIVVNDNCCCLEGHLLRVSYKQDWDPRVILLLPQTAVQPRSDSGSDGVKPLSQHRVFSSKPSDLMLYLLPDV